MSIRSLAEIGTRLEEAYRLLPGEPADAEEAFERYESIAIAILDTSAYEADFHSGELQEYLASKLYEFRLVHRLVPFPDPQEQ